uniref:RNA-dependent RNA polymerase n=1 Tax=Praha narna-like virus 2 TaxID=2789505 RepID=A0A7T1GW41_9VIRU|nr:hypothetical protein [Praha narna-like virus 2]
MGWVLHTIGFSSLHDVATALKQVSLDARRVAIGASKHYSYPLSKKLFPLPSTNRVNRRLAFAGQVSHVGRALPPGDSLVIKKALEEHMHNLTVDDPTGAAYQQWHNHHNPPLPESFKRLISLKKPNFCVYHLWPKPSASLQSKRHEGGLARDYHEIMSPFADFPAQDEYQLQARFGQYKPSEPDWEGAPDLSWLPRLPFRIREHHQIDRNLVRTINDRIDHLGRRSADGLNVTNNNELTGTGSWVLSVTDRLRLETMLRLLVDAKNAGYIPIVKRETVPERGYKARIVTKSPGILNIAGTHIRKTCMTALRKMGPIAAVLEGDHRKAIERITQGGRPTGGIVVSTDLKNATDLVCNQCIRSLYQRLCQIWGLSDLYREVGELILGQHAIYEPQTTGWHLEPHNVDMPVEHNDTLNKRECIYNPLDLCQQFYRAYPGAATKALHLHTQGIFVRDEEVRVTKRGILMGEPLTWFMLNVSHILAVHTGAESWIKAHEHEKNNHWTPYIRNINQTFSLCGDDLIAYWPVDFESHYRTAMTRLGYQFNDKKHFLSPTGGVFTEVLFKLKGTIGRPDVTVKTTDDVTIPRTEITRLPYSDIVTLRNHPTDVNLKIYRRTTIQQHKKWKWHSVDFIPAIPLKGMTQTSDKDGNSMALTIGHTSKEQAAHLPKVIQARMIRILNKTYQPVVTLFRRRGVLPEAPQSLGGLGLWFSPSTSKTRCKGHRRAIALLAYGGNEWCDPTFLSRLYTESHIAPSNLDLIEGLSKSMISLIYTTYRLYAIDNARTYPDLPHGIRSYFEARPMTPEEMEEKGELAAKCTPPVGQLRIIEKKIGVANDRRKLHSTQSVTNRINMEYAKQLIMMDGVAQILQRSPTRLHNLTSLLRKRFRRMIEAWPAAKPVTNLVKAEKRLEEIKSNTVSIPTQLNYIPPSPTHESIPCFFHTEAFSRCLYTNLAWNELMRVID